MFERVFCYEVCFLIINYLNFSELQYQALLSEIAQLELLPSKANAFHQSFAEECRALDQIAQDHVLETQRVGTFYYYLLNS